jgi:uncharacterized membrane protein YGL010W
MSPRLQSYFKEYAAFHQTAGNQACHYLAIPLIVLTLFTFLGSLPVARAGGFELTGAEVALVAATLYYFTLDAVLAALMLVVALALDVVGRSLPLSVGLGLFVFAWILQFIGHYAYEKRSPAFFRNVTHLLVGPLWILAKATGRA